METSMLPHVFLLLNMAICGGAGVWFGGRAIKSTLAFAGLGIVSLIGFVWATTVVVTLTVAALVLPSWTFVAGLLIGATTAASADRRKSRW